ncbi:sigma-54-dependent Fis family transcriptional regulator [Herbaspirillum rubrisubalbicans]|uniref:sigma-54-dependent Fis family transcriptional regulator n=1 Tax=Herbaspirillum rubrisubalbicans TaxID=80842 RepID=UPI0002D99948|nr:sigma-54-dependent Fis family transcriptional regulator [Herbaspirillum rubrisubalbicans]
MSRSSELPAEALAAPERITTARRLFFEEGLLPSGLVPDPVLRSWQRCRGVGYRAEQATSFDPVQGNAVTALRERSHDLIAAALPEFERLGRVLGEGGYGLLLTDAEGFAVAVHGPVQRCGELLRRALRPGVNLAERRIGTSAMSAAMAEGQAVSVFGPEHFFAQHRSLQCAAAPIFGVHGELRGTIDVTRDSPLPQFGVLSLMQDSANAIESALFCAVPSRVRVLLRWRHAAMGAQGNAMLAWGADGEVVAANHAARRLLDLGSDIVGLHHDDLFQGRFANLVDLLGQQPLVQWRLRSGLALFLERLDEPRPSRALAVSHPPPALPSAARFPEFGDEDIARALPRAVRALDAALPVLILGESGCGKEVAAQALHRHSRLRSGPFVAINCGAIPRELIEGELFGHAEGAFTGARRGGAKGRIEQADGGTLFLDEIGDMPLELQTRLLRVLETHEVTRLGEGASRKLEFQLLSATHQPLDQLVQQGRFRADLLFRLDGLRLWLPPLRQRKQLRTLVEVVLAEEGLGEQDLESDCLQQLLSLSWPGNCRQLRAVLRLARVMAEPGELIGLAHLPADIRQELAAAHHCAQAAPASPGGMASLRQHHQALLEATLREVDGNVSAAAQRLGVNRSTLHRWMKKAR